MADLMQAWYYKMTHTSGIQAVMAARIYRDSVPTDAVLPYAVYYRISGVPVHHQGGASLLEPSRIQVTIRAATALGVDAAALAVKAAFEAFRGTMGTGTTAVTVQRITLENEMTEYSMPEAGAEGGTFGVIHDYRIWHNQ
ncbi:MAG: DUF3168 domain-containing protein [Candidatus Atribacteria bacterium]|nr:DUF3168 domain-containing protein [Candidatus Atribacteria bacterium]